MCCSFAVVSMNARGPFLFPSFSPSTHVKLASRHESGSHAQILKVCYQLCHLHKNLMWIQIAREIFWTIETIKTFEERFEQFNILNNWNNLDILRTLKRLCCFCFLNFVIWILLKFDLICFVFMSWFLDCGDYYSFIWSISGRTREERHQCGGQKTTQNIKQLKAGALSRYSFSQT